MFTFVLDPQELASGRTELVLSEGDFGIDPAGIDWGDAAIAAYMADGRVGSDLVDSRIPNRVITVPLFVGADPLHGRSEFEAARAQLQAKVGSIQQRRGGFFRRGDTGLYGEIVTIVLTLPDKTGESHGVEEGVRLSIEAKPDFFGAEIELDDMLGYGHINQVLTLLGEPAVIEGDLPARARIVLDRCAESQQFYAWHIRSQTYDPATQSAATYDASDMTPLDAAAVVGGRIVHASCQAGVWTPVLLTDLVSGPLQHVGSYRVWAKVKSTDSTPQLRLMWGVGGVANPEVNAPAGIYGSGLDLFVSLGDIRIDPSPVGEMAWQGVIQCFGQSTSTRGDSASEVEIAEVHLQALDDYAGTAYAVPQANVFGIDTSRYAGAAVDSAAVGTQAWVAPGSAVGVGHGGALFVNNVSSSVTSHYLKLSDFGFSIPATSTILGIRVTVDRGFNGAGGHGSGFAVDSEVKLMKAGVVQAPNAALPGPWSGSQWYGGETSLWGNTWAPGDINDAGFGVVLSQIVNFGVVNIFDVKITIYFSSIVGFSNQPDAVLYANALAEVRTEGSWRLPSASSSAFGATSDPRGDNPRLPASGLEGRPVELYAKLVRTRVTGAGFREEQLQDAADDFFRARVVYRPCYLDPR